MVAVKNVYLKAILRSFRSFLFVTLAEIGILVLLIALGRAGLLDMTTIISVVVPELGIGVALFYLLGESRRTRVDEVVNLIEASEKFSHLRVHKFSIFPRPFRYPFYFVENISINQYFEAPDYVQDMADRGVIRVKLHKNEKDMKAWFAGKNTFENAGKPSPTELKIGG